MKKLSGPDPELQAIAEKIKAASHELATLADKRNSPELREMACDVMRSACVLDILAVELEAS